jgi:hypothetical protein
VFTTLRQQLWHVDLDTFCDRCPTIGFAALDGPNFSRLYQFDCLFKTMARSPSTGLWGCSSGGVAAQALPPTT